MGDYSNAAILVELAVFVGTMPWLVVVIIGLIVGLRRLSSQPREGWLVICATVLAVFGRFGIPTLANLVWHYATSPGLGIVWIRPVLTALPSAFVQAVVWSLLMLAAFGAERSARSKYLVEDDDD